MKLLTIIPARGGSKGIKDKNIIDINGKPLIQYTIEQAALLKKMELIDKFIVSTDSQKIKNISESLGAEVPFLRPANISGDKSKSVDFILHAIDFFENKNVHFDAVLLLQPTSPLRKIEFLEDAVNSFKESNNYSLISCYLEEYINDLVMYRETNGSLIPLNPEHNKGVRRQEHGSVFIRNGSIYITRVNYLKEWRQIICDNPLLLRMSKTESINLDTQEDIEILKKLI